MQEQKYLNIYRLITKILNTRFNWSLLLLTIIIWAFTGNLFLYFTNQNFDILIYSQDHIKLLSLSTIIFGFLNQLSKEANELIKLGIITYVVSFCTVIMTKNVGHISLLGIWVFQPISIFLFLKIVQKIWAKVNI
jgi:hypothetical protein